MDRVGRLGVMAHRPIGPVPWNKPTANFVMIPKIRLRDDITEANIKKSYSATRASIKSEINSLDTSVYHRKKTLITQIPSHKETVTISLSE